jgi:hypothetical protein
MSDLGPIEAEYGITPGEFRGRLGCALLIAFVAAILLAGGFVFYRAHLVQPVEAAGPMTALFLVGGLLALVAAVQVMDPFLARADRLEVRQHGLLLVGRRRSEAFRWDDLETIWLDENINYDTRDATRSIRLGFGGRWLTVADTWMVGPRILLGTEGVAGLQTRAEREFVARRLAPALREVRTGGKVTFGAMTLDAEGLSWPGGEEWWSEVRCAEPGQLPWWPRSNATRWVLMTRRGMWHDFRTGQFPNLGLLFALIFHLTPPVEEGD